MLNEVGSDRVRLFSRDQRLLQRLAALNGETVSKIQTKAEVVQACVKALPESAVLEMLEAMEQQLAARQENPPK